MYGIISILITIIAFAVLEPLITSQVNDLVASLGAGSVGATVMQTIVPLMAVGILGSLFFYVFPARDYPPRGGFG